MKQQDEKLSLLLDDYSDENVDAVLDEVQGDVNLQYRVRRYRMIGEVMRNELPLAIDTDFRHAVMARIREETAGEQAARPALSEPASATPLLARSWFRPFSGLAVALSVAVVTIAIWQPEQPIEGSSINIADKGLTFEAVPASTRGMRWKLEKQSPVLEQKLNAYLVNHTEYSGSMQGLIPQARVAGFDAQQ